MALYSLRSRYSLAMQAMHWLMAVLIVVVFVLGEIMTDMGPSLSKLKMYGLHKSLGSCVLALLFCRVALRLFLGAPYLASVGKYAGLVRAAAHAGHVALYVLMLVAPLSGWLFSAAAGFPVTVFGMVTLPDPVPVNADLSHALKITHEISVHLMQFVVGVHVGAVILHVFLWKDRLLQRMLPWGKEPNV